ncbi:CTNA1 protein, partial [Podilymbus podiceps]|nr:CTNA1 protein [Podilymbus podiceps]
IQAAGWLLECLSALRDAGDTPGLLAAFRAFSEALLLLSNLTARRLEELGDCPRREGLAETLQLLQKCVPLLHAAKQNALKHSWDQQVNLSKDYAFQLTERTVRELSSLLADSTGSQEPRDRNGSFSQHVSRLLALLSRPDPARLSDSEFGAHVEAVIFYCMLLADSAEPDRKRDLVKHCWVLLRLRKSIGSHVSRQEGGRGHSWGGSSLEKECHTMREEVETLDRAALAATLCQILDTFCEGKEPLRQLVEHALSLAGTGSFPAGQGGLLKKLQPLTTTFFTHAQQMLRAADFVLARCTETQTAREIGERVECLKGLVARLPPLLTEMSRNPGRASAAEQLRSLCHAWAGTTESLLRCFEETVSTRQVLELSVQEMGRQREGCDEALAGQDPEGLSRHAARLTSWAQWVVGATTRYVDRTADPIFRNGLLVWVEQLVNAILELKAATALSPERLSCLRTRDVFSKAASCLMETARRVRDGLDGSNHPDILSPLREQVRNADVAKALKLSPSRAGLKTVTDEAGLQEDVLSLAPPPPGNFRPDVGPRKGDTHPVITALLAAARTRDTAAVNAACSALLELSNSCIDAAKEALPLAGSPQVETLGQYPKIALLTPCVISLARETAPRQLHRPSRLLQTALALSERICETKVCLAAVAGPWYRLSQQVFGFVLSADFLSGKQALEETVMGLAGAVQLAGAIASTASGEGNPVSPDVRESFLQVQAKFSRAEMNTKALLEKAASLQGSCEAGKASLELRCVQWAVSMQVLLGAVDRFIGKDILFLQELRSTVKNKLCSPSLLAAMSENSLRLQEAARLSYLSCPEDRGHREILALGEEIKVLMEALLDASDTLSVSPLSSASVYIRFEVLQRDVALRAKALSLHLEKVNAEHLRVIRDVVGPALSPLSQEDRERQIEAFEEKASRLTANVQWVRTTLQDILEGSARLQSQANLLSVADHLLVLTSEAVGSARQLLRSRGDKGHLRLDGIVWYWSAKARYLLTQLPAIQGISGQVLQLVRRRLQNAGDQRSPGQGTGAAKLCPARELDAPSYTKSAESHPSRSGGASGAAGKAREMVR